MLGIGGPKTWTLDVPDREPFVARANLNLPDHTMVRADSDRGNAFKAQSLGSPEFAFMTPAGPMSSPQSMGARWLAEQPRAMLCDEMGSGKTVQACKAIALSRARAVLIVSPASVVDHWADHVSMWSGIHVPAIVRGTPVQRELAIGAITSKFTAIITTWDLLPRLFSLKSWPGGKRGPKGPKLLDDWAFDVVIADEAHRAKNPKAQRTRALWNVNTKARWALTGTPVSNSPLDLWALLHWLDEEAWRSKGWFERRYCSVRSAPWGVEVVGFNKARLPELRRSIEPFYRRVSMEVSLGRKIEKVRSVRKIELKGAHLKQYRKLEREFILACDESEQPIHEKQLVTRLTQCASAELEDGPLGIRVSHRSPKIDVLV